MKPIHVPGTHPFSFDDPQLRRWRLLDTKDSESRVSLVEQPFPIASFPLFRVEHFEHGQIVGTEARLARAPPKARLVRRWPAALTESLSPLTMKPHLVAVLHTR